MKPLELPPTATLLAAALFLMTRHAANGCPLLAHSIAQQLRILALHPDGDLPAQLRAVSANLARQWSALASSAGDGRSVGAVPGAAAILH